MATTPTDDPLDRTVGVHIYLDQDVINSLKREALLSDQIGIPELDQRVSDMHLDRVSRLELDWLRDSGIVRDVPPLSAGPFYPSVESRNLTVTIPGRAGSKCPENVWRRLRMY